MFPFKDDVLTLTRPVVTILLIALNSLVFFYEISLPDSLQTGLVEHLGLIPARMHGLEAFTRTDLDNPLVTVFSSMFVHGGWLHLLGNMLYLWIFGKTVEDAMGHFRFLFFYLCGGLVAAAAQVYADPGSHVPMIGASGAIAAVLGAYLVLYPFARVYTLLIIIFFIEIVKLPAVIVLTLWFLMQILNSLAAPESAGGVAFHAHVGGFVSGLILVRFFQNTSVHRRTMFG
jgi:membrane associated rhomboid family serine protease